MAGREPLPVPILSDWLLLIVLVSALLGLFTIAWLGTTGIERLANNQARRIFANSTTPLLAQLFNRAVDLVFAAFALRILGVQGNGEYAIATVTWLYLKTLSDFGLSILAARDIARQPTRAGHLVGSTTLFRFGVLLLLSPFVALLVLTGSFWLDLSHSSAFAILLLTLSLLPASYAEAINSAFTGLERLHLPAVLTVFTNFVRFSVGLLALTHGYGVPGVAGAAVFAASCNALALHIALSRQRILTQWKLTLQEGVYFIRQSWPLLLNGLLITLFFRIDTFVIQAFHGAPALGIYDAAYKLPNLLPLIPSYFVLAVFPVLVRQSGSDLRHSFELGGRFLVIVGWAIVLVTLFWAPLFIRILGGKAFLPEAADTLRILIWFTPLHYLNGIAQYAIIAADRQREIAPAYGTATAFNLLANLAAVPRYGYLGSAVITIMTDALLLLLLGRSLARNLGKINWSMLLVRPFLAFLLALTVGILARPLGNAAPLPAVALYPVILILTKTVTRQEILLLRALLPERPFLRPQS